MALKEVMGFGEKIESTSSPVIGTIVVRRCGNWVRFFFSFAPPVRHIEILAASSYKCLAGHFHLF
jgi:hypothetical protein